MGGLIELRGDTLNLQGNVFSACCQEEAIALLEGRKVYPKNEHLQTTDPEAIVEPKPLVE